MIRIIDNKKIDLTQDEWLMYQKICESYDVERRGIRGKDLFIDLFETNPNGIIIFLRPPSKLTSMEVYMFLVSIMIHQHLGVACDHVDNLVKSLNEKTQKLDKKIEHVDKLTKRAEKILTNLESSRETS